MWVATQDLPRSAAHPFYARLNQILDQHDFDGFVEDLCARFYADEGRPNLPGVRMTRPTHSRALGPWDLKPRAWPSAEASGPEASSLAQS